MALRASLRAQMHAQFWLWVSEATGGSAVPRGPRNGLRPAGISQFSKIAGWARRSKATVCLTYWAGRIEIDSELFLAPLIWSTTGFSESSYFMVLRMPSQSVAPLKATGLRKWPP